MFLSSFLLYKLAGKMGKKGVAGKQTRLGGKPGSEWVRFPA